MLVSITKALQFLGTRQDYPPVRDGRNQELLHYPLIGFARSSPSQFHWQAHRCLHHELSTRDISLIPSNPIAGLVKQSVYGSQDYATNDRISRSTFHFPFCECCSTTNYLSVPETCVERRNVPAQRILRMCPAHRA